MRCGVRSGPTSRVRELGGKGAGFRIGSSAKYGIRIIDGGSSNTLALSADGWERGEEQLDSQRLYGDDSQH